MICPVCRSTQTEFFGNIPNTSPVLSYHRCLICGSYFQYPVPRDPSAYYNESYYSGTASFSYIDERKKESSNRFVWDARIKNIRKFQPSGSFLDVGCSFGGLVRSASPFFQARGIDISPYAVENGNRFSQDLQPGDGFMGLQKGSLTNLPPDLKPGSLNVITMIEVIEHLENPDEHIRSAFQLLKPGGLLVIQTANMTAWQAQKAGLTYHYFLPGHLTCFSREGLRIMLQNCGFTRFVEYFPVDFSLIAKLRKLSGYIDSWKDIRKFWNTSRYHVESFFRKNGQPRTSSYVIYAFKGTTLDT